MAKTFFFNGLNELRAVAALSVIISHIELFKYQDGIASLFHYTALHFFIKGLGTNGVYLFFVLSGFLITYLLLKEKDKNQSISLKKFYLRRIHRIWPLYYLVILIAFVLIPALANNEIFQLTPTSYRQICNPSNYDAKSILSYIFFLPNLVFRMGTIVVGGSHLWSVGVEEQFYLAWPLLILIFSRKRLLASFFFLIAIFVFLNLFEIKFLSFLAQLIPFEFMAIGGVGGYFFWSRQSEVGSYFNSKRILIISVALIFLLLFVSIGPRYVQNMFLGVLFLALILSTIQDSNSFAIRNRLLSFLGKISYGIYMYHPFVLFLVFPFANRFFNAQSNVVAYNLFVYFFVCSITIFLSYISYKYFELKFIRIKDSKYKS
jgi:peptidoglycan/LPS O-acetylase OafA/YrhL